MPDAPAPKAVTTHALLQMKEKGERIVMLTCYDALFARLLDASGVDVLLVGDSVNQVLAGADSTLSATLDQMIYHTKIVRRGTQRAMVVCDMPFLTYQVTKEEAIRNGGRVMAETGCQAIKVEGGRAIADTVRAVVDVGIPVMGHLGLTPQSVHALGGHRVQGRDEKTAERLKEDAKALEDAGAFAIVLELVPAPLASQITKSLTIPTIGIGAGPACDGQVLVLHDMLGLNDKFAAKFVKRYAALAEDVREAVRLFAAEVREGRDPGPATGAWPPRAGGPACLRPPPPRCMPPSRSCASHRARWGRRSRVRRGPATLRACSPWWRSCSTSSSPTSPCSAARIISRRCSCGRWCRTWISPWRSTSHQRCGSSTASRSLHATPISTPTSAAPRSPCRARCAPSSRRGAAGRRIT